MPEQAIDTLKTLYAIRQWPPSADPNGLNASVMYSISGPEGPWHDMVSGYYEWCEEVLEALLFVQRHED